MSRRTLVLLGIILGFLAAAGIALYLYYSSASKVRIPGQEETGLSLRDLFFPQESLPSRGGAASGGEEPFLAGEGNVPPLRQISAGPVAASILFTKGSTTMIRYLEKGTGHIYETTTDSLSVVRISNKTIPRIQEAFFLEDGGGLIIRYLSEESVKTAYLKLLAAGEGVSLSATNLIDGIGSIAPSQDGAKIAYVTAGASGAQVFIAAPNGAKPVHVFSSVLEGLLVRGFAGNFLLLASRPTFDSPAVAFLVDVRDGSSRQILRESGLTALFGGGAKIFYSFSAAVSAFNIKSALYDRAGGASLEIPAPTLAEKCAVSERGTFYCGIPFFASAPSPLPDAWYQGALSFADSLWRIDAESGDTFVTGDAARLDERQFDIADLHISDDERYAVFTNKSDEVLWGVQL